MTEPRGGNGRLKRPHRRQLGPATAALAVWVCSCASLERTTAPELSGTYAWEADAGDWHGEGHLTLECTEESCAGTFVSPFGSDRITRSRYERGTLHVVVETPTGTWSMRLSPHGADLGGTFSYGTADGRFDARRVAW